VCPEWRYQIRSGGAGQRVRRPTLTMNVEKWMNSICGGMGACPQENFSSFEIVF